MQRERERERGYFYLPEEKSTSNGSDFQFVKNGNSVASFLQRSFVFLPPHQSLRCAARVAFGDFVMIGVGEQKVEKY